MNKTVIITGAGRGIGYELCKIYSEAGWNTIGISRNINSLSSLEGVQAISSDLRSEKAFADLSTSLLQIPVSDYLVVIHNAGVLINKPFIDTSDLDIAELFEVNYLAPLKLTRALLPLMEKYKKVHNLFLGSMGGFQGSSKYPGLSVYSSMKAAISGLSECLAEEFKQTEIKFNTLALGAVDTEMLEEAFPGFVSGVSAGQMSAWIFKFSESAFGLINGKVIPVAGANP
ncbi:MAG: SDR family oxidoreductase [Bacteroidia bacterium]